jgi:hypothetical protein
MDNTTNENVKIFVSSDNLSYPTENHFVVLDEDQAIVTSNKSTAINSAFAGAIFPLCTPDAITDSGAMQIFIMEGTPLQNKRPTSSTLQVTLADGCKVLLMHECDIHIDGLPVMLTGHIIPELSIASLFGIRVLTNAGCEVQFNKTKCTIWYNGNIILQGGKDATTDMDATCRS